MKVRQSSYSVKANQARPQGDSETDDDTQLAQLRHTSGNGVTKSRPTISCQGPTRVEAHPLELQLKQSERSSRISLATKSLEQIPSKQLEAPSDTLFDVQNIDRDPVEISRRRVSDISQPPSWTLPDASKGGAQGASTPESLRNPLSPVSTYSGSQRGQFWSAGAQAETLGLQSISFACQAASRKRRLISDYTEIRIFDFYIQNAGPW